MSKNFKGYMGDQIGKLGTAVGRKWKRKMVYASYQGRVRNPRTEQQLLVRARFSLLSQLSCALQDALRLGLKRYAYQRQETEHNSFVRLNYKAIGGSEPDELTVGYDELVVSQGALPNVQYGTPSFETPMQVTVPITAPNTGVGHADDSDIVYLVAYCPGLQSGCVSDGSVHRSDGSLMLSVPAAWQGQKVYVFGFAESASTYGTSMSSYLGFGTIA